MNDERDLAAPTGAASIQDRVAAFQMLDGMHGSTQAQKSYRLALCGFTRPDIAAMLGISPESVSQNIYAEKNKTRKKAPKSAD